MINLLQRLRILRNKFYQGETNVIVSALGIVLVSPLLAGSALSLWYAKHKGLDHRKRDSFEDPEFTGFTLVRLPVCNQSSVAETSESVVLPSDIAKMAEEAKTKLSGHWHPNDVIVASYPKSGTTWLSEAVYLIVNRLNWIKAYSSNLEERVPYLEYIWPGPSTILRTPAPRVIKTHLPFHLLPEEVRNGECTRIVYIVRDPRDVVVSYYHFVRCFVPAGYQNLEGLEGFVRRFLDDKLPYSPWCRHVRSYYEAATSFLERKMTRKMMLDPKYFLLLTKCSSVIRMQH
ncbi:unnamed protein product [Heterobilharzia americana]|nr:unnamed protein product [Heterobilharzia americana]